MGNARLRAAWVLVLCGSFLLEAAAAGADFDETMRVLGTRATQELRASAKNDARGRSLDVLGVRVSVGCTALVREANTTLEVRCPSGGGGFYDLPSASAAPIGPALWRLRYARRQEQPTPSDTALLTSVSDLGYAWHYWRWMLNKLCVSARVLKFRYYLWIGAPGRGKPRRANGCPAKVEEHLAHTTKALSMYLALSLAPRVVFLDADAWFATGDGFRDLAAWIEAWIASSGAARLALPAPCYKQFFGAAVVLAKRSAWTFGVFRTWYELRCGPKDQPSLWAIVLRTAGLDAQADDVLRLYHDRRCLNESSGELTKANCACEPRQCGYYAAWDLANEIFEKRVWPGRVVATTHLYEVRQPLFTPRRRVAYLPNVDGFICGENPPVMHVKYLSKRQRDLPMSVCGRLLPDEVPFKGPRDNL